MEQNANALLAIPAAGLCAILFSAASVESSRRPLAVSPFTMA
jgi:hypothetical protein